MTSKLDDIRARLAEYERTQHALGSMDRTWETDLEYKTAGNDILAHIQRDLPALLAVMDAAAEWREKHEAVLAAFKVQEPDNTREAYEAVKVAQDKLAQAVDALTKS